MWGPVLRGLGVAYHFCTDGEMEEDGDGDGLQRNGEEVCGGFFSSGLRELND